MKELIKKFALSTTPPFIHNVIIKYKNRNVYPEFNLKYWNDNKKNFNGKLVSIIDTFIASRDFHTTTRYWKYLMRKNLEQLRVFGIEKYGSNIARNYYTWTDFTDANIGNLINRNVVPQKK